MICVPMILLQKSFSLVQKCFLLFMGILVLLAFVVWVCKRKKARNVLRVVDGAEDRGKAYYILWAVFGALLLYQLFQAACMAYEEGDDAFYVATASVTESSNTMYYILPYTGGLTGGVDIRYGLAPFPIWIAYLARITGIRTVTVAQVLLPPVLIGMAYGVYYLLANGLFGKKKERIPLFLIFVELLILFGDYSIYTPERFLIARSRQGKAALSAIVIPYLIYLMLILLEKLEEKKRLTITYWCMLICGLITACLCSTLGAALTCMLMGVAGICAAVCYRKWRILVPMALSCIPCVMVALLYLMS